MLLLPLAPLLMSPLLMSDCCRGSYPLGDGGAKIGVRRIRNRGNVVRSSIVRSSVVRSSVVRGNDSRGRNVRRHDRGSGGFVRGGFGNLIKPMQHVIDLLAVFIEIFGIDGNKCVQLFKGVFAFRFGLRLIGFLV